VESELVPPTVHHGLQAVKGLSRGRSDARESDRVRPVPEAFVDAIETHVVPQVWAMVQLRRLTGMRPGEVTTMRTCDIDATGNVWIYTPARHKTQCLKMRNTLPPTPILPAWRGPSLNRLTLD